MSKYKKITLILKKWNDIFGDVRKTNSLNEKASPWQIVSFILMIIKVSVFDKVAQPHLLSPDAPLLQDINQPLVWVCVSRKSTPSSSSFTIKTCYSAGALDKGLELRFESRSVCGTLCLCVWACACDKLGVKVRGRSQGDSKQCSRKYKAQDQASLVLQMGFL